MYDCIIAIASLGLEPKVFGSPLGHSCCLTVNEKLLLQLPIYIFCAACSLYVCSVAV